MKNFSYSKYILPALLLAACGGPGNKKPVSDIQEIREKATNEMNGKSNTPNPEDINNPEAPRGVPKAIDKDAKETDPKDQKGTKDQEPVDEKSVKVEVDKKDAPLRFFEQKATAAKIRLLITDSNLKVKVTLKAKDLPAGATLNDISTAKEPNTYELKWTPALNTIAAGEKSPKIIALTLVPTAENKNFLEKVFTVAVFKSQEMPSELSISGLSSKADVGQVVPFSVTVRIPGIDQDAPQKPTILAFADGGTDGSQYVVPDADRKAVEYIDDFKWKFNLAFDTKNKPVNAAQVRFALKVYAPFTASNASVIQVDMKGK